MIKELENKQKQPGSGSGNGGQCPPGSNPSPGSGPAQGNTPSGPAAESALPSAPPGKGIADAKKLKEIADVWGTLPEKERAKAMLELTREMPAKYRDDIERYLKQISARSVENK